MIELSRHAALAALITLATVGVTGCALDGDAEEDVASSEASIIGGDVDAGHPTVALVRGVTSLTAKGEVAGVSLCTATKIAPSVLVTAAHCAGRFLWTDVTFVTQPALAAGHGAANYVDATIVAHPDYDGDPAHGHDVALVLLSRPVNGPATRRGATPAAGQRVTAVGYGMNQLGDDGAGAGVKRVTAFPVTSVAKSELVAGKDDVCHGDSGGPLFVGDAIVAITSYGDRSDCVGSGHFMRLDDNLPFLRTFVPGF